MSTGPLPGFRDFYPQEFAERAFITRAWREVARRYAFVEVDGPPLEPTELYTKKSGDEIVGQLYNFEDKGGRQVALRPEMTPTVARMVAARANALRKPVRWFSIPQLFRYERQQRGRLREHFQLNVDIIGEPDVTADAELLAVAIDIMRELGLTADDVKARVSDRRLLREYLLALGVAESQIVPIMTDVIDKLDRAPATGPASTADRLGRMGLPVATIRQIEGLGRATLDDFKRVIHHANGDRTVVEGFERYLAYLDRLVPNASEWVRFDPSIVRGLAYYTGIVFELFDARGELRAICGGGRYDTLLDTLGGVDLPAIGFGMGDVVLTELLRDRQLLRGIDRPVDYWVVTGRDDTAAMFDVMEVARRLRERRRSVEYSLREQSLGRQLKAAGAAGARYAAIVEADGRVSRKDLRENTQVTMTIDQLIDQASDT
jgi:histidyl-tRNA synthetase